MSKGRYVIRAIQILKQKVYFTLNTYFTRVYFKVYGIKTGKGLICRGVPKVELSMASTFTVGRSVVLQGSRLLVNTGRQARCLFVIMGNGTLTIGDNVGITSVLVMCKVGVHISDKVKIGGGCAIYDSDFHDLNAERRNRIPEDQSQVRSAPVHIGEGAFIGSRSLILKGVTIGAGAVIGSGSVVGKSIPERELWAGNPIRFIKKLE